jgi:hypothetical protein
LTLRGRLPALTINTDIHAMPRQLRQLRGLGVHPAGFGLIVGFVLLVGSLGKCPGGGLLLFLGQGGVVGAQLLLTSHHSVDQP